MLLGSDAFDEHVEEVDAVVLVAAGGLVALGFEDWDERGVGREVGAGFADRFELAVELGGSVAVAVAEEFLVELGSQVRHRGGPAGLRGFLDTNDRPTRWMVLRGSAPVEE
ncbi:MAG: hypothetical protein ACJAR2_000092 [Ilumatobacter sp.]